ncbi:FAD/NAD(P)-binding domain-containing protein [Flagelloscypha sp. PMI_526]|nr:FAD/NAD(P)-binding domain-containing protein [Flagelloscypha sp. PMI_526]
MSEKTKKTILVIGAGAGAEAARTLSQKLDQNAVDVVLVEPLPYKALLPATIRLAVTSEGHLEGLDKAFVPLEKTFPPGQAGRLVEGLVISLTKSDKGGGEATLKSGETILWDYLIMAPGSKWTGPIGFPWHEGDAAVQAHIKKYRKSIAAAKSIVIAGAGAVGIELAGEIHDFYPDKKLTIVQGDAAVLNATYPLKVKRAVETKLRTAKVDIIYNDYIDEIPEGPVDKVITRSGKEIKADLVLSARGPRPNTDLFKDNVFSSSLTPSGTVKVKPTLQVEGFDDIFAIGDIIDWNEQKMNIKTHAHAAVASHNIISLLQRKGAGMKKYKGSYELIFLTWGRREGVALLDFGFISILLGDWWMRLLKSPHLLIPFMRPHYSQK